MGHECGHGAFSDNKRLQDVVGYALHTVLCVPYFSWQRSHHVHHLYTNHMEKGETHVPYVADSHHGKGNYAMKNILGEDAFVLVNQVFHLVFGWPAYLLSGTWGGSEYGLTNHFVPVKPFSDGLFPTETHKKKVWISAAGVLAVIGALTFASTRSASCRSSCSTCCPTWPATSGSCWTSCTTASARRTWRTMWRTPSRTTTPRKRPKPSRRPSPTSASMTPPPSTRPCGASRGTASPCTSTTTSMSSTPRTRPSRRRKRRPRRGRRVGPRVVPAAPQFAPFFKFSL